MTLRAVLHRCSTESYPAQPVFDPDRCSIGFHPLHTAPAILIYGLLSLARPTRLIGVGLLIHMALDTLDCVLMGRL